MNGDRDRVHRVVRQSYARIASTRTENATGESSGCAPASDCCGTGGNGGNVAETARLLGYTEEELRDLPGSANLGLGCGNPHALASLKPGEVVMDLGSGGGIDCFIAAKKVGAEGRVIGVDMTPEMLLNARATAAGSGFDNVEFRLGEIEHLPVGDSQIDVILSNCVINLSPDKAAVFREAFRVLRPGGRLSISDVVATAEIPDEYRDDESLLTGCVAGAETSERLTHWMREAGFVDIEVRPWDESREFIRDWAPGRNVEDYVVSAIIQATKPGSESRGR